MQMMAKNVLLKEIQAEDFAVYEAGLYLDGHPTCREALNYYEEHKNAAASLRAQYEAHFGPLTMATNPNCGCWRWIDSPWPWQKEGN